jgi:hypothetical protein
VTVQHRSQRAEVSTIGLHGTVTWCVIFFFALGRGKRRSVHLDKTLEDYRREIQRRVFS